MTARTMPLTVARAAPRTLAPVLAAVAFAALALTGPAAALGPEGLPAPAPAPAPPGTPGPALGVHEGEPHDDDPGAPAAPGVEAAAAQSLRGTFRVTAGACGSGRVRGSYFRMIQPGGDPGSGPFVENADSPCADKTYTPLRPGGDGGLISGSHQPQPGQPFDSTGNGTAGRIFQPARFFGVNFAVATNARDPQTSTAVAAPVVRRDGARLSGDLRAVGVAWNRQHFNQGAPKPDGTTPGQTRLPTGTIDTATKAYRLEWSSTIVGGPFNNFTGLWHLEGTFDGDLGGAGTAQPVQPEQSSGTGAPQASAPATPNTGPRGSAPVALGLLAAAVLIRRARHA